MGAKSWELIDLNNNLRLILLCEEVLGWDNGIDQTLTVGSFYHGIKDESGCDQGIINAIKHLKLRQLSFHAMEVHLELDSHLLVAPGVSDLVDVDGALKPGAVRLETSLDDSRDVNRSDVLS